MSFISTYIFLTQTCFLPSTILEYEVIFFKEVMAKIPIIKKQFGFLGDTFSVGCCIFPCSNQHLEGCDLPKLLHFKDHPD